MSFVSTDHLSPGGSRFQLAKLCDRKELEAGLETQLRELEKRPPGERWSVDTKDMGVMSHQGNRFIFRFLDYASGVTLDFSIPNKSATTILACFEGFFDTMDFHGLRVRYIHFFSDRHRV